MLCASADVVPTGDDWIAEAKIDGWRLVVHRTHADVQVFAGRNGSSYTGKLPYLEASLMALPPDTVLDGELVAPGGWGDVQGIMTRGNGPHVPSEHDPALVYVVFDITRCDGTDIRRRSLVERKMLLEVMEGVEHVQVTPTFPSTQDSLDAALAQGFEGLVCKRTTAPYANSRSTSWVKIKPQATAEAKVVGFKPGESSFAGMVGALELEMVEGGARTRASGFDMATRRDMTEHPERWLGTIVEIKHHGISHTGVPRHPQFLRRRDDMTAPSRPVRTAPKREVSRVGQASGRNYGAMKGPKLLKCIEELRAGEGDAVERVRAKGADVQMDLAAAEAAARAKGLTVPA